MLSFKKALVFALVVFYMIPTAGFSFEIPSKVRAILKQHPAVQELKLKSNAARLDSFASLGLPDPQVAIGINNLPVASPAFNEYLPTSKSITLKQMFPSLTGRKARAKLLKERSGLIELKSEYLLHQLFGTYLKALEEKAHVHERRNLLAKKRDLLDTFEQGLRALAESNDVMAFQRIAALDTQRADLELRESLLVEILDSARTKIKAIDTDLPLLDEVPRENYLSLPDEPYVFWTDLLSTASTEISRADVKVKLANYQPDFGFSLTYQQREKGTSFKGDDWVSFKFLIRIPFWNDQTHGNRLASARAKEDAAMAQLLASRRNSKEKWDLLSAERKSALTSLMRLKQKALALSEAMTASQNNYESGRGDIAALHTIEMKQLQIKDQIAQQRLKANKASISLHMLIRRKA